MKKELLSKNGIKIFSFVAIAFAMLLTTQQSVAQTITTNTQGTNNGFFYSFWTQGASGTSYTGSPSMTLGTAGNYSTTWSNVNNFTAGKGWSPGTASRTVNFSGSFNGGTNGFLAVYGWTRSPLIEYYVVENYGDWTPPGGTSLGTFTSDGGTYNIYMTDRINQPSIDGTQTFKQFWSVRTTKRASGTVTFANHVAAWSAKGMTMGTSYDYQIMETEGYHSTGSSNITVSEGTASVIPTVSFTAPANNSTSCVGTPITLTASTSIASGSISKVDFYDGTTLLGTSTTSPYSYIWTNPSAGSHTIGVIATSAVPTASIKVTETITVNALPAAPTVTTPITYCQGATATSLTATGTSLKWYTVSSGGTSSTTAPTPTTSAAGTTTYYVSQTTGSCEGPRASIAVTVNTAPAKPTVTTPISYIQNTTASALTATGTALKWYTTASGGTGSSSAPTPSTTTVGTINYYVSQTVASCESPRETISVIVSGSTVTPTVTITAPANSSTSCEGSSITITALPVISSGTIANVEFYDGTTLLGTDTTSPYSYTWTNATAGSHTIGVIATSNASISSTKTTETITVNTVPSAPTVTTPINYMQNATASVLTATGTALKWYTTASGGTGSSSAPTPTTTTMGTVNYYVSQTINSCESPREIISIIVGTAVTTNQSGTNNGYFYTFWNDNSSGSASMNLGAGSNYSTIWSNVGNFVAGKGWATGSPTRVVNFSGSFNGGSNGYLSLYGWTRDSLIEYYVVENYGTWTPPGATSLGTYFSDGSIYNIYQTTRTDQPSIDGIQTFQQYWSVRTTKRTSGTINFGNHVAAWKAVGMNLGTSWDYQIMGTEGFQSSGNSNITISEGNYENSCNCTPTVTVTPN